MRICLVLIGVVCGACASARPHRLAWEQIEPPAVAGAYRYTIAIDGGAHRPLPATCVAAGPSSVCTGVAKMSPGSHLVVIAAVTEDGARQVTIATVNVEGLEK